MGRMKRVLVFGSPGSGKSTFARRLSDRTGLPVIHLDQLFWTDGWVEKEEDRFLSDVATAAARDAWIMDGNYSSTYPVRFAAADTAFFLDPPRATCLWRVAKRTLASFGHVRPDMAAGCPERIDWNFAKFAWRYHRDKRPALATALSTFDGELIHLRSAVEVRTFLERL